MVELRITKIFPLYPNRAYVEFTVDNPELLKVPVPVLTFFIERCEGQNVLDKWELANPQGTTGFYYVDTGIHLLSLNRVYNYRVSTTYANVKYFSPITSLFRHLRTDEILRKRKMLYDEEIVLRKYSGRKLAILKRRHWGPRCTKCYDPNTRSVTKSKCPECFGTSFQNPYYEPFITYGARLPNFQEVDELTHDHGNEVDYTKYQVLDYPTVDAQDMIIELEANERYKVDRVEPTEIRREVVHQELVCTQLARSDIEYKYPIDNRLLSLPSSITL